MEKRVGSAQGAEVGWDFGISPEIYPQSQGLIEQISGSVVKFTVKFTIPEILLFAWLAKPSPLEKEKPQPIQKNTRKRGKFLEFPAEHHFQPGQGVPGSLEGVPLALVWQEPPLQPVCPAGNLHGRSEVVVCNI